MRNLVSGIVGLIIGSLILLGFIVQGGPQGSGPYLVGQYIGLIFGVLFLGAGIVYVIIGIFELPRTRKKTKKKRSVKRRTPAEEYLTFTCASCQSLFKTRSEHTGRRVKCPTCRNSVLVPGEQVPLESEVEDREVFRRSSENTVPIWFLIAGGIMILALILGLVLWLILDRPEKNQNKDPFQRNQNNQLNDRLFKLPQMPQGPDYRRPPSSGGPGGEDGPPRFPR